MKDDARNDAPITIHRADYRPLAWTVEYVDLHFRLDPDATLVTSRMVCARNPLAGDGPLRLWGEALERLSVLVDGAPVDPREVDGGLEIDIDPDRHADGGHVMVEIVTRINPRGNTALSGLYLSNDGFFTQCEAEGFRRITYFPDRPDVMARYAVTLEARREQCPVLLSNGNLVDQGNLPDGWHYARWEDPFPKPSYLFALVAARLVALEREVRTASGRKVLLQVWVEEDIDRAGHALDSLIEAMRWDEARFGLELDLDRFMIVAVADFNMGAMENKGLNIFNAKYVLAAPGTATDADYEGIESVVAHEYFHNWTGNRVTCRDWFQLTLKEGLTVFRDQQFSADMLARAAEEDGAASARAVRRIANVRTLRAAQFPEDNGPMAHPIRPESYREINNFYTATVYEKGAEVIRMIHTLLGEEGFRAGMALYFERHDGHAVTCDDFVDAMAAASGTDLGQFMRWYAQAGTPRVIAHGQWDAESASYTLTLSQHTPSTPGQTHKEALVIPVAVGLIGPDGRDLPLRLAHERATATTRILVLDRDEQTFRFEGIHVDPVPSVLRGFSAPVMLEIMEDDARLAFRMAHDADPFNRWDAAQRYSERTILVLATDDAAPVPPGYLDAFRALLLDEKLDPAFRAEALALPSENYLLERMIPADPAALRAALITLTRQIGRALAEDFHALAEALWVTGPYRYHPADAGRRALANLALRYLVAGGDRRGVPLAFSRFGADSNMTGYMGALAALMTTQERPARDAALATFRSRFGGDALVLDKWLALQASAWRWSERERPVLARVRELMKDPAFKLSNPNKVYALLGVYFRNNPAEFHSLDGEGHAFWAEQVLALDAGNPQVAARLARALENWRRYIPDLQPSIQMQLSRVKNAAKLSPDVAEIIDKALDR
ncbi:MAG: aminopeptidase N [Azoarcus sp.]|jgi:aminopeptidase N|nr:aminopeptidase N [Azoarcus sp.]